MVYHELGELELALDFHKRCLVIYEEIGNKQTIANSFYELIAVTIDLDEIEQAKDYLNDLQLINEPDENKCLDPCINLLSRLATVPQEVKYNHNDKNVGFIQPGETVTFEYASSGMTIGSDQFIINKTSLNKHGITIYEVSSDLV